MSLVCDSAAIDKYGFFSDKTVYVAIFAKVKAQLHGEPGTFATFKQLMIQFRQRARNDCWDDTQFVAESDKLVASLESTLSHHLSEIELKLIRKEFETPQQDPEKRHSILDFLEELKGICDAEISDSPLTIIGNSRMLYSSFIGLMQEYIDDLIDYQSFLRRGLDLCDGVSRDVKLQARFLGQFCTDINLNDQM
jgi:hypothetical protein